MSCCWAGAVASPDPCPWGHLPEDVSFCVGHLATLLPTLSMDDDYPEELIMEAGLWFAPALMVWREML